MTAVLGRLTPREQALAEENVTRAATLPFALPAFDLEAAKRAHSGTSMTPELRALGEQRGYIDRVVTLYEEVLPLAESAEQRAILNKRLVDYATGYLGKLYAKMGAQSRVVSTLIAGPANFPTRQMNKRAETEHKRLEELLDWDKRERENVKKAILALRTPEQLEVAGWAALKRWIDRDMALVHGYDTGAVERYWDRNAFVTGVTGRLARLSKNGEHALVVKGLDYIAEQQAGWKKPFLTARNGAWKLREVATAALAAPPAPEPEAEEVGANDVIEERDGITILRNRELDRVQIIFPGKPDAAQREKLRGAGWNWSPTNQAWQRKLTNAAEYSAKYVLGWS